MKGRLGLKAGVGENVDGETEGVVVVGTALGVEVGSIVFGDALGNEEIGDVDGPALNPKENDLVGIFVGIGPRFTILNCWNGLAVQGDSLIKPICVSIHRICDAGVVNGLNGILTESEVDVYGDKI